MASKCPHCKRNLVGRYFIEGSQKVVVVCAKCDSVPAWPEKK